MTNFTVIAVSNGVELEPLTFDLDVVMSAEDWATHNVKFKALVAQMSDAEVVEVTTQAPEEMAEVAEATEAVTPVEAVQEAA